MGSAGPTSVGGAPLSSNGSAASNAGGGLSLAGAGLSAYSTILQSQGTAAGDTFKAEQAETAATYGDLKAVQTGGQMTRNLNQTLGNIDAVRAAANANPDSPTGVAVRDNQESIGNENRSIAVNSILQQSLQDQNDAAYYNSAASNALTAGDIGAAAGLVSAVGKGVSAFATGGASLAIP
jgi:hypothetical protein